MGEALLNFKIEGGKKLRGEIAVNTSKNGAVAVLCAALLNRGTTTIRDVPQIEEVERLIEVLESIGVSVIRKGRDMTIVPQKRLTLESLDRAAAARTRSIILFIAPLLHLSRRFRLPQAGGCKLGSRTVRPHFFALETLGARFHSKGGDLETSHSGLKRNQTIILYEASDTATENTLLAAAGIQGTTTIKYASANYQVQELCFFLERLGICIDGIGTTTLVVHGKKNINKKVAYALSEDPPEAMFFLTAAIATHSSITIRRCPIEFLELELLTLEHMGFRYRLLRRYKAKNGKTNLADIKTFPSKLHEPPEKIHARPYPGLNMDNLPFFALIATQAKGQTLIHDWTYEKRALYYTELDKLGADTILADPHRFYVNGPTTLRAAELVCPPALRPAALLLLGMLGAKGTSILRNVYSINRGYEDLVNRLTSLGAKIALL